MGQDISCPCHNNDSNVYLPEKDNPESVDNIKVSPRSPTTSAPNTGTTQRPSTPFGGENQRESPINSMGKSRKWDATPKGGDGNGKPSSPIQVAGQDAIGDGDRSYISREDPENEPGKGENVFPGTRQAGSGDDGRALKTPISKEEEVAIAARAKQEAHNDRIVATFNSVMLADGLKVLKHHRRSSRKPASRVIRFVPDYGGALVWDKPLRQPGAKASRVPLDAINQVELEARIVWISAGDERVGFETSKSEDADLMYQAICILVDRCHV